MVQRKLFSGHKKRSLVKPFVITSSNGRIINVYGDNAATDNDAFIMDKVLQNDKDLGNLPKKGDLAIFDCGFKECIARLEAAYGLNCKIPTFNS
ncbi:disulfide-isomerase A6-like [Brachionus plicatilis]|uniref:Disulfide-isomerase A6-like n=1 Tax=Brachionus plicatilis TaxID=10195 RepID=A0A3M7QFW9_BRAPC|nr:disulfide-isomerase A6-like [Brachionus plicatilis]